MLQMYNYAKGLIFCNLFKKLVDFEFQHVFGRSIWWDKLLVIYKNVSRWDISCPWMKEQVNSWGCKGFLPDFPQTCPKSFCATSACKFSHTKIVKTFFGGHTKDVFLEIICHATTRVSQCIKFKILFFYKRWSPFLEDKRRWALFFTDFHWFCSDFRQIKSFGGAFASPASPPSTSLILFSKKRNILCCISTSRFFR